MPSPTQVLLSVPEHSDDPPAVAADDAHPEAAPTVHVVPLATERLQHADCVWMDQCVNGCVCQASSHMHVHRQQPYLVCFTHLPSSQNTTDAQQYVSECMKKGHRHIHPSMDPTHMHTHTHTQVQENPFTVTQRDRDAKKTPASCGHTTHQMTHSQKGHTHIHLCVESRDGKTHLRTSDTSKGEDTVSGSSPANSAILSSPLRNKDTQQQQQQREATTTTRDAKTHTEPGNSPDGEHPPPSFSVNISFWKYRITGYGRRGQMESEHSNENDKNSCRFHTNQSEWCCCGS